MIIDKFKDDFAFLSNFASCTVNYEGINYPTVEHAFQAAKSLDDRDRTHIAYLDTPAKAKTYGRTVKLRPDWEVVKVSIMEDLLRQKFSQEPFKTLLIQTGSAGLIEGNHWHDTFWGVCNGVGQNHLGKLLMKIRKEIQEEEYENERY